MGFRRRSLFLTGLGLLLSWPALADPLPRMTAEIIARDPAIPSVAARAVSRRLAINWTGAARGAAETGPDPIAARPFRIASTTKLFVAASVLRLAEDGKLALDRPIADYVGERTVKALRSGGYDPSRITVAQLLAHTSGLADHTDVPEYEKSVLADGQRRWSRDEQIELAVTKGKKVGEPGQRWSYSDTGYVILGEIIERRSGQTLATAVRNLLHLDRLGLHDTWFETLEPNPRGTRALPRLTQKLGAVDVTRFDPSFDLWGGGGVVSTVDDLVLFMDALIKGKLFHRPETLALALAAEPPKEGQSQPSHGLMFFNEPIAGLRCIGHAGFWNVDVVACPEIDLVVAVTLNQPMTARPDERRRLVAAIVEAALRERGRTIFAH